jgi:VanZ family protein
MKLSRLASLLLPPLAVMALIFFLSAQPDDAVDRTFWEVLIRKLGHVTEYFLLTLAWWRALDGLLGNASPGVVAAAATVSILYAGSDEFHQTFVDGRNGTPVDVLIDSIGIALACWVVTRRPLGRRSGLLGAPGEAGEI